MRNSYLWFSVVFAVFMFIACDSVEKAGSKVEYLPFLSGEDRKWGLISPDGKVLVDDEFEECPSPVVNGRFLVAVKGGYRLYAAGGKPEAVGGTLWVSVAGDFTDGVAPAVEKGGTIVIIDRNGHVVKDVGRLNGKSVIEVSGFLQGAAIYRTSEDYYGLINTAGEVIVDAQYVCLFPVNGGKTVGIHRRYETACRFGEKDRVKYTVLGTRGNVLGEIDGRGTDGIWCNYAEGLVGVLVKEGDATGIGLLSERGKRVAGPFPGVRTIYDVRGETFVFGNSERKYGVMNFGGGVLIQPEYDRLCYIADDVLAACHSDADNGECWYLVNIEGKRIGESSFRDIRPYGNDGCNGCIVQTREGEYCFADLDGGTVKLRGPHGICQIATASNALSGIMSDKVDMEDLITPLRITKEGMRGYKLGMGIDAAIKLSDSYQWLLNDEDTGLQLDAETPGRYTAFGYWTMTRDIPTTIDLKFSNHSGSTVLDSSDEICHYFELADEDDIGHAASEKVVINSVGGSIGSEFTERLAGRKRELYEAVAAKFRTMGETVKDNGNALVVHIADGRFGVVLFSGKSVSFGIVAGNGQDFDIAPFADVSEENPIDKDFFTQVIQKDCVIVGVPVPDSED